MLNKVKGIIAEHLLIEGENLKSLGLESRLEEDLGADSLDMIEIVTQIEDEFDVKVPDEIFYSWKKVEDIIDYLNNNI